MPLPSRVSDLTGFDLLLSVARLGSLGRAAAEHGTSQPAASTRMRLLDWGVDGLTTDYPDRLADCLRAWGVAF